MLLFVCYMYFIAECLLPKDIGPCDADIERYYYDTETKSCKEFRYGGCQGNKNNFIILDACKSSCRTGNKAIIENCNSSLRIVAARLFISDF